MSHHKSLTSCRLDLTWPNSPRQNDPDRTHGALANEPPQDDWGEMDAVTPVDPDAGRGLNWPRGRLLNGMMGKIFKIRIRVEDEARKPFDLRHRFLSDSYVSPQSHRIEFSLPKFTLYEFNTYERLREKLAITALA